MGRGTKIKHWTMSVSPQGIDVKQKDLVEKWQPEMHQISCDWKAFLFKNHLCFREFPFFSWLQTCSYVMPALYVIISTGIVLILSPEVLEPLKEKIAKGDYTDKPQKDIQITWWFRAKSLKPRMFHSAKTTKKFDRKTKLSKSEKREIVQATLADCLLTTPWDLLASLPPTRFQDPMASVNLLFASYLGIYIFASLKLMIDRESSFYVQAGPYSQVLCELWMQIPAKHLSPDLQQLVYHLYRESSHRAKLERLGLGMEIQINCFKGCARFLSFRAVKERNVTHKRWRIKQISV